MSDLAGVALQDAEVRGVVDESHDEQVVEFDLELGGDGEEDDGQDAGAVLARRLRDELLDPVGQALDVGAVGDEPELVLACTGRVLRRRDGGAQRERRVLGAVDGHLEQRGVGLVEQSADVCAGKSRGHQPERGQRRVSPADVGVGVEDVVAGVASGRVQRGAGIGDDDDAFGRVDAEVAERGLEGPPRRVGLHRRAGLRRHDERRALESAGLAVAVERRQDLPGCRRVEDHQRDARGAGDDLGREG